MGVLVQMQHHSTVALAKVPTQSSTFDGTSKEQLGWEIVQTQPYPMQLTKACIISDTPRPDIGRDIVDYRCYPHVKMLSQ